LTVGSPDANGQPANSIGSARLSALAGDPGTPADEADARLTLSISDVRNRGTLTDYSGELRGRVTRRITDRYSGASLTEAATTVDIPLEVDVPCSATASSTVGASCTVATSLDAVLPGSVREGSRAIVQLDRVQLFDGGTDGDADTAGNTLFATQGVFIP
jgi:hypothetical protein